MINQQKTKIAILISGRGSNMMSLLKGLKNHPQVDTILVISNKINASGIDKAQKLGYKTIIIDDTCNPSFENKLLSCLQQNQIDLILLAGFMKILSSNIIQNYDHKILNIHPSLLPKFPGLNTHEKALNSKEKESGATVHWVTEQLDQGPIIKQKKVKINLNESVESLSKKVLQQEHILYPEVVNEILDSKIKDNTLY